MGGEEGRRRRRGIYAHVQQGVESGGHVSAG